MLSKEFHKREVQEIRAFFKAVGMIRSSDSIPGLSSFLEGKKWFARAKADEIRACAIDTLVRIGTDEAREVLALGMDSRDEFVRERCYRALKELS
jgi:HEAT repeat protein